MGEFDQWTKQYPAREPQEAPTPFFDDSRPRIDRRLAIRDMVDHLLHQPVAHQPFIAHGMYVALVMSAPWLSQDFLDRLRDLPACADTADTMLETIYFLGPPDRGKRGDLNR